MRTSFEFKIAANNATEARKNAIETVARFLEIPVEQVTDDVNLELKVSYPAAETLGEIVQSEDSSTFVVTVYGSVKQSVAKPFGF